MVDSVNFSTDVGGDGTIITNDRNATTGIKGGGHIHRYVKSLSQVVAVAGFVVAKAIEVSANAASALASKNSAAASAAALATVATDFSSKANRALDNITGTLAAENGGTGVTTLAALKTALGINNVVNVDTTNASNLTSGTIPIERLPPSAVERLYLYAGAQTAPENFGLTTANVQNGDTVKVSNASNGSNGLMWIVKDDSALNTSAAFEAYSVGSAASVSWSGVTGVPANLTDIAASAFLDDDIVQKKAGVLTHRTLAQLAADLASGIISTALTGFTAGAGTVTASDSILQAINKIVGNLANCELASNKSTSMSADFNNNTKSITPNAVYDWAIATFTQIPVLATKAIFGFGTTGSVLSLTNLVSSTGVVATDVSGAGTARCNLAAAGYGTDKAIFGYGTGASFYSLTNLVGNTGVVATDTTGVGTARNSLAAAGYGTDKAIFGYGTAASNYSLTNLVSNTGVVATNTTGVGSARYDLAAAGYGTDKAIFGYGTGSAWYSLTNLVSNTGVVSTDTTGVGTARKALAAAGYGTDKAIFGYGWYAAYLSLTNLVSNTGVVATDTTGVGTARGYLAAATYNNDKAIFGYGNAASNYSLTNLVSNTGVVATDTTGVGTARNSLAAAMYGS